MSKIRDYFIPETEDGPEAERVTKKNSENNFFLFKIDKRNFLIYNCLTNEESEIFVRRKRAEIVLLTQIEPIIKEDKT